jgi:hypothetical protein
MTHSAGAIHRRLQLRLSRILSMYIEAKSDARENIRVTLIEATRRAKQRKETKKKKKRVEKKEKNQSGV